MKWTQTAVDLPITFWESLKRRLKVDDSSRVEVMELAAECVAHAELKLQTSLMQRTITATYWGDDYLTQCNSPFITNYGYMYTLPRGPVISITSVKDANNTNLTYKQYTVGTNDRLLVRHYTTSWPITVVYEAGYGTIDDVPADILRVIKVHIATAYMLRESVSTLSLSPVESVDEFYRLRGRGVAIA